MNYAYVLEGETFQHRQAIKDSGWFRWDVEKKRWVRKISPSSIKDDTSILKWAKGLPGVSIVEEPADRFKVLQGKLYW